MSAYLAYPRCWYWYSWLGSSRFISFPLRKFSVIIQCTAASSGSYWPSPPRVVLKASLNGTLNLTCST